MSLVTETNTEMKAKPFFFSFQTNVIVDNFPFLHSCQNENDLNKATLAPAFTKISVFNRTPHMQIINIVPGLTCAGLHVLLCS